MLCFETVDAAVDSCFWFAMTLCCENRELSYRYVADMYGNRHNITPWCDIAKGLQIAWLLKTTWKWPYDLEIRFLGFLLWPQECFRSSFWSCRSYFSNGIHSL